MDNDDYRRGKPTAHKVFGEANAILAGDALLTLAFNIISKNLDPKIGLEVIKELSEATGTKGMVGGQVMDLEFSASGGKGLKKDKKMLTYINRLKTARLFEASARLGAIVAGSKPRETDTMAKFGTIIGMAFQIVDDLVDGEGYIKIFGLNRSHQDAKNLVKKAKDVLRIFGKKADLLKDIADYVLTRIG